MLIEELLLQVRILCGKTSFRNASTSEDSAITTLPNNMIELYDFLWDNKGDKIKRKEMITDYSKGGGGAKDDRYC